MTESDATEPPTFDIDRETFCDHAGTSGERADQPAVVRTVVTLEVDTTPLAAYAALTGRADAADRGDRTPYAFLLESAEKTASSDPDGAFRPSATSAERHARYSYVGYDPEAVVTVESGDATVEALSDDAPLSAIETDADGDTVDALRAAMPDVRLENVPDHDRQHLEGGLVGFLAYDAVYALWLEGVGLERPDSRFPDAQFLLTTKTLAFDERDGTVSLVFTPVLEADDDPEAVYDALVDEAAAVATTLRDRADGLVAKSDGTDWEPPPELTSTLRDVAAYGDSIDAHLEANARMTDVIGVVLGTEYAVNMTAVRHIQNEYAASIPEEALAEFRAVEDLLESVAVVRQFYKTIAIQQDLATLSRLLVYSGMTALVAAIVVTLVYRTNSVTLPVAMLPAIVSIGIGVIVVPLALFVVYVLRAATVARQTVSVGPFVPPRDR